jgi:hypothetical protein
MEYWRHIVVAALAKEPQEWRPLGQVFSAVADAIPMHSALRRAATMERLYRRRTGNDTEVRADDLDLGRAQWQLFSQFVLPLVERKTERVKSRRDELVRLKPSPTPCQECAGPTYLVGWSGRKVARTYVCPRCTAVPAPPIIVPLEPARPPLVVVPNEPAALPIEKRAIPPAPVRLVLVPKAPPPPREVKTFRELASLSSLKEIWDEFAWTMSSGAIHFPRFEENRKLRWTLHRALEAGAGREYREMAYSLASELQLFKFKHPNVNLDTLTEVSCRRAMEWLEQRTPTLTKDDRLLWATWVTQAFHFGSLVVVSITLAGRLGTIRGEMEKLLVELEPPKRKQRTAKLRWLTPLKNNFRWRIH